MKLIKQEKDEQGNVVYQEYENGYWEKREYDEAGNETYWKDSYGSWSRLKRKDLYQIVVSDYDIDSDMWQPDFVISDLPFDKDEWTIEDELYRDIDFSQIYDYEMAISDNGEEIRLEYLDEFEKKHIEVYEIEMVDIFADDEYICKKLFDENENEIYLEYDSGYWEKNEYDKYGMWIAAKYSEGYDDKGRPILPHKEDAPDMFFINEAQNDKEPEI